MKLLSRPIDSTDSRMELLNFKNTIYFQNMNSHELVPVGGSLVFIYFLLPERPKT